MNGEWVKVKKEAPLAYLKAMGMLNKSGSLCLCQSSILFGRWKHLVGIGVSLKCLKARGKKICARSLLLHKQNS
jgi:hypothetical protein